MTICYHLRGVTVKKLLRLAWDRFNLNSGVVADINGRFIATLFYFTILLPFGLLSTLFMDPLRIKTVDTGWHEREPVPTDIKSAKEQG